MRILLLAGLALAHPLTAQANGFKDFAQAVGATILSASREDTNTYIVREYGTEYLVRTRYCYVYAYGEDAVIHDNVIYFIHSNESCDVEGIYRK